MKGKADSYHNLITPVTEQHLKSSLKWSTSKIDQKRLTSITKNVNIQESTFLAIFNQKYS